MKILLNLFLAMLFKTNTSLSYLNYNSLSDQYSFASPRVRRSVNSSPCHERGKLAETSKSRLQKFQKLAWVDKK